MITDVTEQPERTVWSTSPSYLPYIPWVVIPVIISLLANHQLQLVANWFVERTYPTIPWTENLAIIFIRLFPWLICVISLISAINMALVRFTVYELTNQRLKVNEGVLFRSYDEIALHRIRDYSVSRPLSGMIFGLGNIKLITRDPTHPVLMLHMVDEAYERTELIRKNAMEWKVANGYREIETGDVAI